MKIILASESQRRRELLKKINLKFKVIPSSFDESKVEIYHNSPEKYCSFLAYQKALDVSKKYPNAIKEDSNKNGITDIWLVDDDNNGRIDTAIMDLNENGIVDTVAFDENENENFEIILFDEDEDGNIDRGDLDKDDNGFRFSNMGDNFCPYEPSK